MASAQGVEIPGGRPRPVAAGMPSLCRRAPTLPTVRPIRRATWPSGAEPSNESSAGVHPGADEQRQFCGRGGLSGLGLVFWGWLMSGKGWGVGVKRLADPGLKGEACGAGCCYITPLLRAG